MFVNFDHASGVGCTGRVKLRGIGEHLRQHLVEHPLLEGAGYHATAIGVGNVVGIAAHIADQHRQPGDQRLEQHGAGIFVIGRMDQ